MLFDPLQMVVPFAIRARMAMQETWLLGIGWGDQFPSDLKKACQEWWRKVNNNNSNTYIALIRMRSKRLRERLRENFFGVQL